MKDKLKSGRAQLQLPMMTKFSLRVKRGKGGGGGGGGVTDYQNEKALIKNTKNQFRILEHQV